MSILLIKRKKEHNMVCWLTTHIYIMRMVNGSLRKIFGKTQEYRDQREDQWLFWKSFLAWCNIYNDLKGAVIND